MFAARVQRLFGTFKSAGHKVSAKTHRAIVAADRARDTGAWAEAAMRYASVLEQRPDLVHIRIQRGHALKENRRLDAAAAEYRRAVADAPLDRDARLHLAHALKSTGDLLAATELYVSLAVRDPDDTEAMREARDLLGQLPPQARQAMAASLSEAVAPEGIAGTASVGESVLGFPSIAECGLVFDASDLIAFFSHSRRPTGIQRVQIEILTEILRDGEADRLAAAACCFIDGRDCWVEIPAAALLRLMRMSGAPGPVEDPAWRRQRDALHLRLLVGEPVDFRHGATLVNLGTSWWLHNYFLRLRDMQARRGILYVPMIHDMIPVILPDLCLQPLVRDFVAWATGVFDHSRTFLANSEATKRDIIACAAGLGHVLHSDAVKVIRLDALPSPANALLTGTRDETLHPAIGDEPYVLFVATIEPRKGHVVAFDAWEKLTTQLGVATPRLICVGRKGWHTDPVTERLALSGTLRERVVLLENLDEAALTALYEGCLFAIYPSLYEGWGLPVTEALAYGKLVITTTAASLPEAGGPFAIYIPPGDSTALADAVATLVSDRKSLAALTARIARDFVPRAWADIARELAAAAVDLSTSSAALRSTAPPTASFHQFHWIGRSMAVRLHPGAENGEGFRAGEGWNRLEKWGCRVSANGGRLTCLPSPPVDPAERLTAEVRIIGLRDLPCGFNVAGVTGDLAPGERRTVFCPVATSDDGLVSIEIAGTAVQPAAVARRCGTVGVEGFAIHRGSAGTLPNAPRRATGADQFG